MSRTRATPAATTLCAPTTIARASTTSTNISIPDESYYSANPDPNLTDCSDRRTKPDTVLEDDHRRRFDGTWPSRPRRAPKYDNVVCPSDSPSSPASRTGNPPSPCASRKMVCNRMVRLNNQSINRTINQLQLTIQWQLHQVHHIGANNLIGIDKNDLVHVQREEHVQKEQLVSEKSIINQSTTHPHINLCFSVCPCNHLGHLYSTNSYSKPYSSAITGKNRLKCGERYCI